MLHRGLMSTRHLMIVILAVTPLVGCKDKDALDTADEGEVVDTTPEEEGWSLTVSGPASGTAGDTLTLSLIHI